MSSIKRDVKKKSSGSTGGEKIFGLDIQPTAVSVPPDWVERFCSGWFALSHGLIFRVDDNANRVWKGWQASPGVLVSTMVLWEA
jgi:hypothetical protein